MMYTPEQVLTVGQAIRSQLPELLDTEPATRLDRQLAQLLEQANAGQPVASQILELLITQPDAVRDRALILLNSDELRTVKGFDRLPGDGEAIEYPRFQCPVCDFIWSQIEADDIPPKCQTDARHGIVQRILVN